MANNIFKYYQSSNGETLEHIKSTLSSYSSTHNLDGVLYFDTTRKSIFASPVGGEFLEFGKSGSSLKNMSYNTGIKIGQFIGENEQLNDIYIPEPLSNLAYNTGIRIGSYKTAAGISDVFIPESISNTQYNSGINIANYKTASGTSTLYIPEMMSSMAYNTGIRIGSYTNSNGTSNIYIPEPLTNMAYNSGIRIGSYVTSSGTSNIYIPEPLTNMLYSDGTVIGSYTHATGSSNIYIPIKRIPTLSGQTLSNDMIYIVADMSNGSTNPNEPGSGMNDYITRGQMIEYCDEHYLSFTTLNYRLEQASYITSSDVEATLEDYVTQTQLDSAAYITQQYLNNAGYITTSELSSGMSTAYNNAKNYTDTRISSLINGAPGFLDTLGEISAALSNNQEVGTAITTQIVNLKSDLHSYIKTVYLNGAAYSPGADNSINLGNIAIDHAKHKLTVAAGTTTANSGNSITFIESLTGTSTATDGDLTLTPTKKTITIPDNGNAKLFYGTCSTAADTTTKVVTCSDFTSSDLVTGALIFVTFTTTNSAAVADISLNVNNTGAKHITKLYNATANPNLNAAGELKANKTYLFGYDGTNWVCLTLDYNSTGTSMTVVEIEAGTGTSARTITPARLKYGITYWMSKNQADWNVSDTTSASYILNKPILNTTNTSSQTTSASEALSGTINLHKVSKTGDYNDLNNRYWVQNSGEYGITDGGGIVSAPAVGALARGSRSLAPGIYSTAVGEFVTAYEECSHAEGMNTMAAGVSSHSEGEYTSAIGRDAHSEGFYTLAFGKASHSEGGSLYSYIIEPNTTANGIYTYWSSLESNTRFSVSYGYYSHTEGWNNIALGEASHAEGNTTAALGDSSHSEGIITIADSNGAHAEGDFTVAEGYCSHAEGHGTFTEGDNSHAEGAYSRAYGNGSHAEGLETSAEGSFSHTEGISTVAEGYCSHTEGNYTYTTGLYSHAEGNFAHAYNFGEHAAGHYNISHKANNTFGNAGNTLNSIGFGSSESTRKNAIEVMQNGNTYIYGVGNYNGSTLTSAKPIQQMVLPNVTSSDNGKILQVVNGAWSLVTPVSIYTGSGTPAQNLGNNGDIYVQS